ncbi:MAG: A/G-specific adenine glycosylase [Tissierellia bacterium]|nr:A/G-specific adenine glycosylase [Tissierellia bacterium]
MTDFSKDLLNYYDQEKRDLPWRRTQDPYKIWVSEIMLQQTQVETVIPYYERFLARLPRLEDLAGAPEDLLFKLWEGLGYYSRVQNMKKAAQKILQDFGGHFPTSYEDLKTLPGIGPYTAGALASIAFGQRVGAIDGNVLRIMTRIFEISDPIDRVATKRQVAEKVQDLMGEDRPGDFNQALMDLGSDICRPKDPQCGACPVTSYCGARKRGTQAAYPIRQKKKAPRKEKMTILLIYKGDEVLLVKRPNKGLLKGLWSFPTIRGHLTGEDVRKILFESNYRVCQLDPLPPSKHLFSHLHWSMVAYRVHVEEDAFLEGLTPYGQEALWLTKEELLSNYAIPSAYGAYIRELI